MISKEYYIGMDVHKEFVQMSVLEEKGENPIYERKLNNDNDLLVKEVVNFARKGKTLVAYEAGCLGYVLYRAGRNMRPCLYEIFILGGVPPGF